MTGWSVEHRTGSAAELHARDVDPGPGRRVEVLDVERMALVLGSAQPDDDADAVAVRAAGAELVRRRSGGGAILLVPGGNTWVDVTIGRDDPLWDDDVAVAFHWLGRAWAAAARRLGVDAHAYTGRPLANRWSKRVCFAAVGAGEVVVGARKLVGISQRRTRAGARFQCVVHRSWDPGPILALLDLAGDERRLAAAELADVATGLDVPTGDVVTAFCGSLPT